MDLLYFLLYTLVIYWVGVGAGGYAAIKEINKIKKNEK